MRALVVAVVAALGSSPALARAGDVDKAACVSSYEQGQRAKLHSQLLLARRELAVCAMTACPESLRPECVRWLDEVNRAMPSVVLQARGASGVDKTNVRVLDNGKPLVEHLDGKPIELDPGPHELRFESDEPLPTQRIVVVEGQKERLVTTQAPPLAALRQPRTTRPVPAVAWITGGITIAAAGAFGVLAGVSLGDYDGLGPCRCGAGQDAVQNEFVATDVLLGVAVVSLVTTFVLVVTRPTKLLQDHVALFRF